MSDPIASMLELLVDESTDELSQLLVSLRWLMLKHPIAAQAAYRTLIMEGRRFAATTAGQAWRARLEGSELVRRGVSILEFGTLGMLDADDNGLLPTQLIDAFSRAASRRDLEEALARHAEPEGFDEESP
jgi:hypothetical protein